MELHAPVDLSPALCEMLRACSHRDVLEEGTGDWYVAVGEACLAEEGEQQGQFGAASVSTGGRGGVGGAVPRIAEQEPALLRIPGPATITRFGAVIVNAALVSYPLSPAAKYPVFSRYTPYLLLPCIAAGQPTYPSTLRAKPHFRSGGAPVQVQECLVHKKTPTPEENRRTLCIGLL